MRKTCSAVGLSASRLGPPSVAAPRRHLYASGSPAGSSEGCTEVGRPGRFRRMEAMEERWSVLLRFSHPDIGLAATEVGPGSEELEVPLNQEWKPVSGSVGEDSVSSLGGCCGDWSISKGADTHIHVHSWCQATVAANGLEAGMPCLQPDSIARSVCGRRVAGQDGPLLAACLRLA